MSNSAIFKECNTKKPTVDFHAEYYRRVIYIYTHTIFFVYNAIMQPLGHDLYVNPKTLQRICGH